MSLKLVNVIITRPLLKSKETKCPSPCFLLELPPASWICLSLASPWQQKATAIKISQRERAKQHLNKIWTHDEKLDVSREWDEEPTYFKYEQPSAPGSTFGRNNPLSLVVGFWKLEIIARSQNPAPRFLFMKSKFSAKTRTDQGANSPFGPAQPRASL